MDSDQDMSSGRSRPPDPPPYEPFPVERVERVYDSPWCGLRRDVLRLPDGRSLAHHVIEISDAIVVVPVLPDGRLVLIWQFRHVHGGTHWEVPAGRVDPGEPPEDAARRELLEETGCTCTELVKLPGFYPINGISDHWSHAFAALGCEEVADVTLGPLERLQSAKFEPEDVRRMLTRGEIVDGFSALPLWHWLGRGEAPE